MQTFSNLIESLKLLPGIGSRSANRIAYHLLQHNRAGAKKLGSALLEALNEVRHCEYCYTLSESAICKICSDLTRDQSKLCVVETPADQVTIEQSGGYKGLYFVLMGALNPLDNIGPHHIGFTELFNRIQTLQDAQNALIKTADTDDDTKPISYALEVIIATNFTAPGEITLHAITEQLKKKKVRFTCLARGIPAGGELEYIDLSTIAHAIARRS
jgi:recombination protein RecR